jgi:hypothetical protein
MTDAAIRLATVLGLSVVIGSGLAAQRGDGAWFGYGLGLSVAHPSRTTCFPNSSTQCTLSSGTQVYMKLGATPSQFVRVGGALQGWVQFSDPSAGAATILSITGSLYFFPLGVRSGFFLTGGVGESKLHSSVPDRCGPPLPILLVFPCGAAVDDRQGPTFAIGMGYAPLSRRVSFAPKVAYLRQAFGTCSAYCPDYVVEFGLDVTYH